MKDRTSGVDWPLMLAALAVSLFGLFAVWDSGYARAAERGAILPREVISQSMWVVLAVVAGFAAAKLRQGFWRRIAWPGLIASVVLIFLVEVPGLGVEINGSKRWIGIGPFTIQPSEFAKFGVILFLSAVLAFRKPLAPLPKRRISFAERLDWEYVPMLFKAWPVWITLAIALLVELQSDLGTAAAIVAIMFGLLFAAGVKPTRILTLGLILGCLGYGMIQRQAYRQDRVSAFADRWDKDHRDDVGYQGTISESGLAEGGVFGRGLGEGKTKHILPVPTTDFIMATIGEEFGLLGSLSLLGLIGFIVFRLLAIASRAPMHARLLMTGLAVWIAVQTCTNMMMANGALPTIGIPLPFVSAGGSSLLALWIALGAAQGAMLKSPQTEEVRHAARRNGWRNGRARVSRA
jgi:cell division protein FtsW